MPTIQRPSNLENLSIGTIRERLSTTVLLRSTICPIASPLKSTEQQITSSHTSLNPSPHLVHPEPTSAAPYNMYQACYQGLEGQQPLPSAPTRPVFFHNPYEHAFPPFPSSQGFGFTPQQDESPPLDSFLDPAATDRNFTFPILTNHRQFSFEQQSSHQRYSFSKRRAQVCRLLTRRQALRYGDLFD